MDQRDPIRDLRESDELRTLLAENGHGKHHLGGYSLFLSHLIIDEKERSLNLRKKLFTCTLLGFANLDPYASTGAYDRAQRPDLHLVCRTESSCTDR